MKTAYVIIKIACVVALTIAFIWILYDLHMIATQVNATTQQLHSEITPVLISTKKATDDLDATVLDARRTVLIAGGTLNIVRDTMRDEQKSIKASIDSSNALVKNSSDLVEVAKNSLAHLTVTVDETLKPIPPLLDQTRQNLFVLESVEKNLIPLTKNTSDTMEHISGITADTQTEIHRFVYPPPQPWYSKYIIDPIKIGVKMVTIPVR